MIVIEQSAQHLCLAFGAIDRTFTLDRADLARMLRALVDQFQQLVINRINTVTMAF